MLFGSSGIRGLANQNITPQLALQIGRACGALYKNVVVGQDSRTTSPLLTHALMAGAMAAGADVTDVGLVSTPTLAYVTANYDTGVMITASHNPAQYNGIKLFNPDGAGFSLRQSADVEAHLDAPLVAWDNVGRYQTYASAIDDHIDAILGTIPSLSSSLKVVVDCASGSTGGITPYVLKRMGCRVTTLNAQADGFFPAHDPEPLPEHLVQLRKVVTTSGADLGIAHDCDGDRMVAVTGTGLIIPGDALLALLARYVNEQGTVAVSVNTSRLIDDALPKARVERTRVGDIFISQKLKENNGDFGGEPAGTYVFPSFSYCPDGVFAAAFLTHLMTKIDLDEAVGKLPCYHTLRGSVLVEKKITDSGMQYVEEALTSMEHHTLHTIDGVRIDSDDAWILVRPSGTEPKVRVTVESHQQATAEALFEQVIAIVRRCFT